LRSAVVIPNKRFDGSPEDALRAALEKLAISHVVAKAA
jgi:hypothetical protein